MRSLGKTLLSILICGVLLLLGGCGFLSLQIERTTDEEQVLPTDEDILVFLEAQNLIATTDKYMAYDRDIGLFGPEGDKRHIYQRENGTCYFVRVSSLSYSKEGDYWGYAYQPSEVFFRIDIQDCTYDPDATSMDVRIKDVFGDLTYYIVSVEKEQFALLPVTP